MDNSVALVTGANKGIGQEIARQFAAAGLTVYVGSRDAAEWATGPQFPHRGTYAAYRS